jgi:hypothetical protein
MISLAPVHEGVPRPQPIDSLRGSCSGTLSIAASFTAESGGNMGRTD